MLKRTLKSRIKKLRNLSGMTQEELADKIGMSRAYVGYIEQGRNVPTLETLDKIARALKIPVSKLI